MTARKPVQLSAQALMRIIMAALQEERIKAIKDERIIKAMWEGRGRRKWPGWPADQKPSDLRRELLKAISEFQFSSQRQRRGQSTVGPHQSNSRARNCAFEAARH